MDPNISTHFDNAFDSFENESKVGEKLKESLNVLSLFLQSEKYFDTDASKKELEALYKVYHDERNKRILSEQFPLASLYFGFARQNSQNKLTGEIKNSDEYKAEYKNLVRESNKLTHNFTRNRERFISVYNEVCRGVAVKLVEGKWEQTDKKSAVTFIGRFDGNRRPCGKGKLQEGDMLLKGGFTDGIFTDGQYTSKIGDFFRGRFKVGGDGLPVPDGDYVHTFKRRDGSIEFEYEVKVEGPVKEYFRRCVGKKNKRHDKVDETFEVYCRFDGSDGSDMAIFPDEVVTCSQYVTVEDVPQLQGTYFVFASSDNNSYPLSFGHERGVGLWNFVDATGTSARYLVSSVSMYLSLILNHFLFYFF